MKSEYAAAFEKQLDWLRWEMSPDAETMWDRAPYFGIKSVDRTGMTAPGALTRARGFYRHPLLYGEVCYVSPKIHEWLLRAHETGRLPEIPLDPRWCPAEYGFVVLPKPLDLSSGVDLSPLTIPVDVDGKRVVARVQSTANAQTVNAIAFGWSPSARGLEVCFYSDRIGVDVQDELFRERIREYVREHPEIRDLAPDTILPFTFTSDDVTRIESLPGYYPIAWFEVATGETWRAAQKKYREIARNAAEQGGKFEHADVEIAYLYAFLMFVNDRRTVRRTQRADRAQRKREAAIKPKPHQHITVVMLRAEEEAAFDGRDPNSVPIPRNYTVRWNVREHMRRHPRTGQKTIHVRPYVKGPPDAPFKDDQRRIFAVIR